MRAEQCRARCTTSDLGQVRTVRDTPITRKYAHVAQPDAAPTSRRVAPALATRRARRRLRTCPNPPLTPAAVGVVRPDGGPALPAVRLADDAIVLAASRRRTDAAAGARRRGTRSPKPRDLHDEQERCQPLRAIAAAWSVANRQPFGAAARSVSAMTKRRKARSSSTTPSAWPCSHACALRTR